MDESWNRKPRRISLYQSFLCMLLIIEEFFFVKAKGKRQINAIVYRSPAKVNGGISASPIFIITNDVDQRKVTSSASRIAFKCDCFFTS